VLICIFAGAELEFRIRGGKLKKKNWKAKTKKITKFSGKIIYIYNFFFFLEEKPLSLGGSGLTRPGVAPSLYIRILLEITRFKAVMVINLSELRS
jgi:hypothetical protein